MSKIVNSRNNGNPAIRFGEVLVNSKNVSPTTVVAVATTGTVIRQSDADAFDFFNVAQTSAGTDLIRLASNLPVGTTLEFFVVSAVTVRCEASSGQGINGGTDAQGVALTANTSAILRKVSATRWICTAFSTAGAVSNPTPA
jgi:hypothetical protein